MAAIVVSEADVYAASQPQAGGAGIEAVTSERLAALPPPAPRMTSHHDYVIDAQQAELEQLRAQLTQNQIHLSRNVTRSTVH